MTVPSGFRNALAVLLLVATGCGQQTPPPDAADGQSGAATESRTDANAEKSTRSATQHAAIQLTQVLPAESGIDYQHVSGNAADKPFPAANGSGAGAIDCDLDGFVDLYFATGRSFPLESAAAEASNRLYRNRGGWQFQDVTQPSGLGYRGYSVGVAVGDLNADGFPDVYLTCFGDNQLFINQGDGSFQNVPVLAAGNFSTSAAWLDYDEDGLLDLYVGNYGQWSYQQNQFCGDRSRDVRIFCSPNSLDAETDYLLHNNGDGTFQDVTAAAGLAAVTGRAQGVLATDVNVDGHIDLYIGNDIHPNFLFLNSGDGHFQDATEFTGTAYDRDGQMQAGMGVASADINRDGAPDLFVTNFEKEYNTLYVQAGAETFFDSSMMLGLAAASQPWVGWGTAFVDFDHDGWKDLIVTNGHVDDNLHKLGRDSPYEQPALVWKNQSGRFEFLGESVGRYFQESHPGRGLITADLDNDNDTDIVITHQDEPPALLRNDSARVTGASLTLRMSGRRSNRDAVGTRLVFAAEAKPRTEQIQGGGSYLSAHDLRVIAASPVSAAADVTVYWPSGIVSRISGLQPGGSYDILEPVRDQAQPQVWQTPAAQTLKVRDDRRN